MAAGVSGSRGFGEMFAEKKGQLDNLQASLAGKLFPKIPGMPVSKFYDLSIGIDFHPTVAPPSMGVPVPVPHIGMIFDIMAAVMAALFPPTPPAEMKAPSVEEEEGDGSDPDDSDSGESAAAPPSPSLGEVAMSLLKGMAPTVKVHQRWIGQAGISIQHLPGIFLHALPTVIPLASSEMWMGSATVLADGSPCSTQFHPALSCNIVGIPSIFRKGKPPKPKVSLMAPLAALTTITSVGKPVLVGGPPTIDLFQLCMKLGLKGLGKAWKKIGDKFQKFIANVKNPKLKKILQAVKCRTFGEPVDVVTGRVYHTNTDFELPGPVPLVWERRYYSDAEIDGPLGYNWHHSYNMGIFDTGDSLTLRLSDGRETALPHLVDGDPGYFDRIEQLTWRKESGDYVLEDAGGLLHSFGSVRNRQGYRMLSSVSTRDGFSIRFRYNGSGDLLEIIDSRNQRLQVETDPEGRITCISMPVNGERVNLIRYRYDDRGNMVETKDANDTSKHFEYNGHLLSKLTNQSGTSFYWEYEGRGDNARCVHTWGDRGVLEYRFEYGRGVTHVTNSLGHRESYYYDPNHLIYKIVDSNGGITHQEYNASQELVAVTNPEGLTTKTVFNAYGKVTQRIDENGNAVHYAYDRRLNLTGLHTPGGASLSWEYDRLGRVVERTNASGETFRYGYEGNRLETVTDSQGNRIELSYSDRNDLVGLSYSNGLSRRWEYDDAGRLTLSEDVNGNLTRYRYDRMDHLVELEEADGNVHRFSYDASGELINAKDRLHEVSFTYGPMGILKSRRQNGRSVGFVYNRELQLRRITNEASEEYCFELDAQGQVVKETGFDGLEREYVRDGAGRVTRVIRPEERWTEYMYDGVGNVIREEHHDGTASAYVYNPDGLLVKAENSEGIVELGRDKAGRIIRESFGGHSIERKYDEAGNCIQIGSSLGADIRQEFDCEGNLMKLQSGSNWQADWQRDRTGLELHRQLTGGVSIRTERDRFGRETHKSVGVRNIEQSRRQYQWGMGNRLLGIHDERTGRHATFDYDAFDNLVKADYQEQNKTESIYRAPNAIGNLFETPNRTDRKYDRGGRLTEDPNYHYYYDCEGNLIFKEFKKPQGYTAWGRQAIEKKFGIKMKATGTGWYYKWLAGGMLQRVISPQQGKIDFGYDPLGRRVWKESKGVRTNWLWDGNVPLHEWQTTERQLLMDVVTWVFEDGSFVPVARITDKGSQSIVTDYLGTPTQIFSSELAPIVCNSRK